MFVGKRVVALAALVVVFAPGCAHWSGLRHPLDDAEKAIREDPLDPGAPAVILYREDSIDDGGGFGLDGYRRVERCFYRIKILTDAGRRFADVEVPYRRGVTKVGEILARVIQPDGSVKRFEGKVYDKTVLNVGDLDIRAKSFSIPDVAPGSIVEYSYAIRSKVLLKARWGVQSDLDTLRASFRMSPQVTTWDFSYVGVLPPGIEPTRTTDGLALDVEKVPAFREEPMMPPRTSSELRVDFLYTPRGEGARGDFWMVEERNWRLADAGYVESSGTIAAEAKRVVGSEADPEKKARLIYARVGELRNLRFEKSQRPRKTRMLPQVLADGEGTPLQLALLYVGMARSVGLDAYMVRVGERDKILFNPKLFDRDQLDSQVVAVKLDGRETFIDPGTPECPFGTLPWQKTGTLGLRIGGLGGMVTLPMAGPAGAVMTRTANLDLAEDGSLKGSLDVEFDSAFALERRLESYRLEPSKKDEAIKKSILDVLPTGATVGTFTMSGWNEALKPLDAKAEVEIPDGASVAGDRLFLPLGVTTAREQNPFTASERTYPVYFRHAEEQHDDVTIRIPRGWTVESLPGDRTDNSSVGSAKTICEAVDGGVRIRRDVELKAVLVPRERYAVLRQFFAGIVAANGDKIVLRRTDRGAAPR